MHKPIFIISFLLSSLLDPVEGQPFYFGADLSYVNEMEDCGETFFENGQPKDVYQIFAEHEFNLVRLRLWHTPSWYDNLNAGNRYSDLGDVKQAIARAKAAGMDVLLDFHLSDNWADPSKQVVPAAWAGVVDSLPLLKDSLYNYIYSVLIGLNSEGLLPEMVQIGNETNKGILLSQEVNDGGWVLDWDRNSQLFNRAIDAIHDVEAATGQDIAIALHVADPQDAVWLFEQFIENGVTDFDVMGISYYWAWHQPTTITQTGDIIEGLIEDYPGYDVMIFETGYIWTTASNDNANNIINGTHPLYHPASPESQRRWLIDLTQEVINSGGKGVIYWEPAWISSSCWTQWGQGSHQEHATFFNFQNNLIDTGGIAWPLHPYENLTSIKEAPGASSFIEVTIDSNENILHISIKENTPYKDLNVILLNAEGKTIHHSEISTTVSGSDHSIRIPSIPAGVYFITINSSEGRVYSRETFFAGK